MMLWPERLMRSAMHSACGIAREAACEATSGSAPWRRALVLVAAGLFPLLSGCFEVVQVMDTRRDGTIHMSVRISVSRDLPVRDEVKDWRLPMSREIIHDTTRVQGLIHTTDLSDDAMMRRQFEFTTNRSLLRRVSESDHGMLLPYPDEAGQWVFVFRPVTGVPFGPTSLASLGLPTRSLLSAATYRLVFRGAQPRRVVFTALDGRRSYLRATSLAEGVVVDVPVLLLASGGVLTTGPYWNLDLRRTDRLVSFIKDAGPLPDLSEQRPSADPRPQTGPQTDSSRPQIPRPESAETSIPAPAKK